jgi:predicted kinase
MASKVVVSGAPGTGKTTVATLVAKRLAGGFLSLDTIKEALADVLGLGDEDWSNHLGDAAEDVLFRLAGRFPTVVAETWWRRERRERAIVAFRGWAEIFCTCAPDLASWRMRERVRARRHPIHRDVINPDLLNSVADVAAEATPLGCGSALQTVDTGAPFDLEALVGVLADATRAERGTLYVIVSGPPGSGKTTLGEALAGAISLPLLSKDVIKESLMDSLTATDLESSRQLGKASMTVLYALAQTQPPGAVVESNFHRSFALPQIQDLPGRVAEIFCRCEREVALQRYLSRATTRHYGHFDVLRRDDDLWSPEVTEPLAGGWPVVEVNTTEDVDMLSVISRLRRALPDLDTAP